MWAQEKVGLSDTIELGGCVMDGRVGARLRGGALVAVMCARVPRVCANCDVRVRACRARAV